MKSLSHRSTVPEPPVRDPFLASQMAVTEERSRLGREIHDTLAQAFTSIILQADNLEFVLGSGENSVKDALGRIQELARAGLDEARRAVRALRPKALEGRTLADALEETGQNMARGSHFTYEFRQRGRRRLLSPDMENELFRIAQEAMNNAREHARASRLTVTLEYQRTGIQLTIQDDGIGFAGQETPDSSRGHGLTIMDERTRRIGGRLRLENLAVGGAVVRVEAPVASHAPFRTSRAPVLPAGRDRSAFHLRQVARED